MTTIQARKTEENELLFFPYGAVEENDIEKLKDMAEKIFPVLCTNWKCDDITFIFIDSNRTVIDTFRLWS